MTIEPTPTIRLASFEDALQINNIYNWYLEHSIVTFDIEPWPLSKRETWMRQYNHENSDYSLVVALHKSTVIGFACNSQFRPKYGYRHSTEMSVYTAQKGVPKGTETLLYDSLFLRVKNTSLHRAYGIIALPNEPSVKLHEKFGFHLSGTLNEVGIKLGHWINVAWYEKHLD